MSQILLSTADRRLLMLLQADCQKSNAEIAADIGMSSSACWRRIKSLETAGVISGYGARLRPAAVGYGFGAIVHVQLIRHDTAALDDFVQAVASRPEILECFATTGAADYHLRVMSRDIEAYNEFLEAFLFKLPAVRSAQTNVILKVIKQTDGLTL